MRTDWEAKAQMFRDYADSADRQCTAEIKRAEKAEAERDEALSALQQAEREAAQWKGSFYGVVACEKELREALERLLANAEHIFDKEPVRDWGETLAEARAALAGETE